MIQNKDPLQNSKQQQQYNYDESQQQQIQIPLSRQQQQQQEIEWKFARSNDNNSKQAYQFPRVMQKKLNSNSAEEFSSDDDDNDSVNGVTVYNLHEQNLRNYERERFSFEINAMQGNEVTRIVDQAAVLRQNKPQQQQQQQQQQQYYNQPQFEQNYHNNYNPSTSTKEQYFISSQNQQDIQVPSVAMHNNLIFCESPQIKVQQARTFSDARGNQSNNQNINGYTQNNLPFPQMTQSIQGRTNKINNFYDTRLIASQEYRTQESQKNQAIIEEHDQRVVYEKDEKINGNKKIEGQQQFQQLGNENHNDGRFEVRSLNSRIPTEEDRRQKTSSSNSIKGSQKPQVITDKKNIANKKNPGSFALSVNINLNLELAKKGNDFISSKAQLMQQAEDKLSGNRKAAMKLLDNRNSWNSSTKKNNEITIRNQSNIPNNDIVIASITSNNPINSSSSNSRRMKTEGNEGMIDGLNNQNIRLKTQQQQNYSYYRTLSEPTDQKNLGEDREEDEEEDTIENFEQALQDAEDTSEEGEIALLDDYQQISTNMDKNQYKLKEKTKKDGVIMQQQPVGMQQQLLSGESMKQQQRQQQQQGIEKGVQSNSNQQIPRIIQTKNNAGDIAARISTDNFNSQLQTDLSNTSKHTNNNTQTAQLNNKGQQQQQQSSNSLAMNGLFQQQRSSKGHEGIANLHQFKNSLLGHIPNKKPSAKIIGTTTAAVGGGYHSKISQSSQLNTPSVPTSHLETAATASVNSKYPQQQYPYDKPSQNNQNIDNNLHALLKVAASSSQSKRINTQTEDRRGNNIAIQSNSQQQQQQQKQYQQINEPARNKSAPKNKLSQKQLNYDQQKEQQLFQQQYSSQIDNNNQQQPKNLKQSQPSKPRTASSFHQLSSHKQDSSMTPSKLAAPLHSYTRSQHDEICYEQSQQYNQGSSSTASNHLIESAQKGNINNSKHLNIASSSGSQANSGYSNNKFGLVSSSQKDNSDSKRNLLQNSSAQHLIGNALRNNNNYNAPQFASIRLSINKQQQDINLLAKDQQQGQQQQQQQQFWQNQQQSNQKYSSNPLSVHQDYQLMNIQNPTHNNHLTPSVAVALSFKKTSNHKNDTQNSSTRRLHTLSSKPSSETHIKAQESQQQQQHMNKTPIRDTNTGKARKQIKTEETVLFKGLGISKQSETLPIRIQASKIHSNIRQSTDYSNNNNISSPRNSNINSQTNIPNPNNIKNSNQIHNNQLLQQPQSQTEYKYEQYQQPQFFQQNLSQSQVQQHSHKSSQSYDKIKEFLIQKSHVKAASSIQYHPNILNSNDNFANNCNQYQGISQQQSLGQSSEQNIQYMVSPQIAASQAQQQYFPTYMQQ